MMADLEDLQTEVEFLRLKREKLRLLKEITIESAQVANWAHLEPKPGLKAEHEGVVKVAKEVWRWFEPGDQFTYDDIYEQCDLDMKQSSIRPCAQPLQKHGIIKEIGNEGHRKVFSLNHPWWDTDEISTETGNYSLDKIAREITELEQEVGGDSEQ